MAQIETLISLYKGAGHSVPAVRPAAVPRRRGNAFDAAGSGRRAKGWLASTEGINSLMFANAEMLRNRARDAVRKNPWAANAIDSYTANAIGTGIKPFSQHETEAIRKQIHQQWRAWTDESDFDEVTDFYGQQAMVFRSMMEAGEVLVRFHAVPGARVPLQLQILEADHLPLGTWAMATTKGVPVGHEVRYGIEFDARGKRSAYHIYRDHPGETVQWGRSYEIIRVPASEMIHVFRPLRPGQARGQSHLTTVLVALYELDQYTDAALVRKKIAAMFAGYITKAAPEGQIIPPDEEADTGNAAIVEAEIQPGTLQQLMAGEEITFPNLPTDADDESFVRSALRRIAAGCGITYEMLSGDLTGVNYSSIRAGLLEFRRKCEQLQHAIIVHQFCRRVYRTWLRMGVLSGALNLPGFAQDPTVYEAVRWITPGWPWVDPLKDITAAVMEVRGGFSSRADKVNERGEDVEAVDAAQSADNARADKAGLSYDSDGRRPESGQAATNRGNLLTAGEQPPPEQKKPERKTVIQ